MPRTGDHRRIGYGSRETAATGSLLAGDCGLPRESRRGYGGRNRSGCRAVSRVPRSANERMHSSCSSERHSAASRAAGTSSTARVSSSSAAAMPSFPLSSPMLIFEISADYLGIIGGNKYPAGRATSRVSEALRPEYPQCLAHCRARDPEDQRELRLHQDAVAGSQRPADDQCAQLLGCLLVRGFDARTASRSVSAFGTDPPTEEAVATMRSPLPQRL